MKTNCPHCHAHLSPVTLQANGSTCCPFCDQDVSEVLELWNNAEATAGPTSRGEGAATADGLYRTLPAGSRLKVLEANPRRVSLLVPSGWSSRNSRWFGVLILLLLSPYGAVFWFYKGFIAEPKQSALITVVTFPVVLLFPAFLYVVARNQVPNWFRQVWITLEAGQITFRTRLFGREEVRGLPVSADTVCALTIVENTGPRIPRYEVLVRNPQQQFVINNCLSDADQEWLVRQISSWVAANASPTATPETSNRQVEDPSRDKGQLSAGVSPRPLDLNPGGGVPPQESPGSAPIPIRFEPMLESEGFTIPLLQAADLPASSEIRILENEPGCLRSSYPLREAATSANATLLLVVIYGICGFVMLFLGVGFSLLCLLALALVVAYWLYCEFGEGTIRLTPETLECVWSSFGVRFPSRLPVESIQGFQVGNLIALRRSGTIHRPLGGVPPNPGFGCGVLRGATRFQFAPRSDVLLSFRIQGLILGRLSEWGVIQVSPAAHQQAASRSGE
jgi:hypothetical protein